MYFELFSALSSVFESQLWKITLTVFDPIPLGTSSNYLPSQLVHRALNEHRPGRTFSSVSRHYLLTENFRLRLLCRQTQFFSSDCCCRRVRPTIARKLQGKEPPVRGLIDKLSFRFGESWRCMNFPSYPCSGVSILNSESRAQKFACGYRLALLLAGTIFSRK